MECYNNLKQTEEMSSLCAIYGDDWTQDSDTACRIRIAEKKLEAILYVTVPSLYPSKAPPNFELSAPWMCRETKAKLLETLDRIYLDNKGEPVIFMWVEKIRETLHSIKSPKIGRRNKRSPAAKSGGEAAVTKCPEITHGEVIVDRKSSFQAHAAEVHSVEEINAVIQRLKENKKVANATHNVVAWRFERTKVHGGVMQDCSDDGESQAGGRLMHLVQRMQLRNVLVVVTRWRGPVQLGPDRFRHYNNAAKQVVLQAGLSVR